MVGERVAHRGTGHGSGTLLVAGSGAAEASGRRKSYVRSYRLQRAGPLAHRPVASASGQSACHAPGSAGRWLARPDATRAVPPHAVQLAARPPNPQALLVLLPPTAPPAGGSP